MRDIYENLTKDQLVKTYSDIVKQLDELKSLIDAYAGQKVELDHPMQKVVIYSKTLEFERIMVRNILLKKYGIFVM